MQGLYLDTSGSLAQLEVLHLVWTRFAAQVTPSEHGDVSCWSCSERICLKSKTCHGTCRSGTAPFITCRLVAGVLSCVREPLVIDT